MGSTRLEAIIPVKGRQRTDRTIHSLIATAAIVAIAALIACWFGTREVTNGIVNYEGRKSARDWAISFSHSLSHAKSPMPVLPLRPYSSATSPEHFTALDNAMFEGEILSYRLYSTDGVVVVSSQFEDIGVAADAPQIRQVVHQLSEHDYFINNETRHSPSEGAWTVTALAPLTRGSDTIGIIEVTVDNSDRAQQLNRLRYMAFGALATLLASIFGILGFSISRTLQKHRNAQQALALSERQHRQLLDGAPDSMVIHNQREVLYVNDAAVTLHGASSKEDLLGIDPIELAPEEQRTVILEYRRKALAEGRIQTTEMLGRRQLDGNIIETDSMGIPIEWDGQPCILIQSRDMTAQRTAQREIAEREAQLTAFMENTRSVIFIKSLDGRMILVNTGFEEFYNTQASVVIGSPAFDPTNTHLFEQRLQEDEEVLNSGKAVASEALTIRADGAERMMRNEKFPIKDSVGRIVSIGSINTDITDIQEREEQSRRSQAAAERAQAQLSAFLDNSPSAMYLKDRDRNLMMVNRAFEDFYDVTSDDIVGKPISNWRPGPLTDDIDTLEMSVIRLGETMDMEAKIPNAEGEPRDILISKFPIFAPNGDVVGVGGVNRDITDIRQQELEVRETQARLAAYIDHIPMMVLLLDRESRFLMVNSLFADFFGVDAQKIVGKIGHGRFSPEQHEMFKAENRDICDRQISVSRVIEMPAPSGETRIIQQTKFPIVTGGDVPVAVGVVQHDITEQKNHERDIETARDKAESANRAKSAFLANMSHEIRTPMNGVFGMADLLAQSELSTDQQRYLNTIRRSGEALLGVINNVLDVSRVEAGEFELDIHPFNLHDVIAEATELFAEGASAKNVFIAHNIAGNVPIRMMSDSIRLRQVLINLLGNAIKFTNDGSVVIRADRVGGDDTSVLLRFEVTDTGIGIERDKLNNLFQPFQQADTSITRKFGGSGLGLSIAGHIVGLMGGRIDVESRPGAGTSFVFTVSMAIDKSKTTPATPEAEILSGKRLLIVDSNRISLDLLSGFAKDWNMAFVAVSTPEDAEAALIESVETETPFDAALIDIVASEKGGFALAEWISERPGSERTRLVGLAPFNWHHDPTELQSGVLRKFVTKPIRRAELAREIVAAISNKAPSKNEPLSYSDLRDDVSSGPLYSANVLLAEDNPVNQEIAHEFLTRLGCTVTITENGHEAITQFSNASFDIVFMDVQMPEMDGIEATRRIRKIEEETGSDRTPIIAATAHAFQEDRDKCISAGMDDFLSKPYLSQDIPPLLDHWLEPNSADAAASAQDKQLSKTDAETQTADILDSGTITQLRELDSAGGNSILRKIAKIFIETTPPQIEQLKGHVASGNCNGIMLIAHSIKTSSANVAALTLSDRFRALESAALDEDVESCRVITAEITDLYEDVVAALRQASMIDIPDRKAG